MAGMMASGAPRWRWISALTALGLADIAAAFETIMVMAALNAILVEFQDPASAGWMVTAYLLVSAISAAVGGRLADLIGRRQVLIGALSLGIAGSALSYVSDSLVMILVGRAIQGTAGAVLPITLGLVREHCPQEKVSLSIGLLLSASGVASTVGLIVGALIVDGMGWRYIFAASAIVGVIALLGVIFLVPGTTRRKDPVTLDVAGALLFMPTLCAFLIGIDMLSSENRWPAAGLMMAGFALSLIWVRHELRHGHPLIDVRLLARREIAIPNICAVIWAAGSLQFTQIQMLFLQQPAWTGAGLGLAATVAALIKMPAKGITMFVTPAAGHLVSLIGSRYVVMLGFALAGLGWAAMLTMPRDLWTIGIIMTLGCAVGISVIYAGLSTAIVVGAPLERTSEAAGVLAVSRTIGQAIGVQITMLMLASWPASAAGRSHIYPSATAYQIVFFYILVTCALGVLAAAYLPSGRKAAGTDGIPSTATTH